MDMLTGKEFQVQRANQIKKKKKRGEVEVVEMMMATIITLNQPKINKYKKNKTTKKNQKAQVVCVLPLIIYFWLLISMQIHFVVLFFFTFELAVP